MALGMSRRAVHHWAAGTKVSAHHARRLRELAEVVAANDLEDSTRTRPRIKAPDPRGRSIIDQLARASRPDRAVPMSTQSLAGVLDGAEPLANSPAPEATRPDCCSPSRRSRRLAHADLRLAKNKCRKVSLPGSSGFGGGDDLGDAGCTGPTPGMGRSPLARREQRRRPFSHHNP